MIIEVLVCRADGRMEKVLREVPDEPLIPPEPEEEQEQETEQETE